MLPNVTGITTKQEEKDAEDARLKAAVAALERLTIDQLKELIKKARAELKSKRLNFDSLDGGGVRRCVRRACVRRATWPG